MLRLLDRVYLDFNFNKDTLPQKRMSSSYFELQSKYGDMSGILTHLNSLSDKTTIIHTDVMSFAWFALQYFRELYPNLPDSEIERLYTAVTDNTAIIEPTFSSKEFDKFKHCRVPVDMSAIKFQGGFSEEIKRQLPFEALYGDFLNKGTSSRYIEEFKEKIRQYTIVECHNYISNLRDVIYQRAQKFSQLFPEAPIQPGSDTSISDCFNQPYFSIIHSKHFPRINSSVEERRYVELEEGLRNLFNEHSVESLINFGYARFNWNFKNEEMQKIASKLKGVLKEKLTKMCGAVISGDYLHYLTEGGVFALIDNTTVDEVAFLSSHNVIIIERMTNLKKSEDILIQGYALE